MAVTSREKRGRLEDVYALSAGATPTTSLRAALRSAEQQARLAVASGSVKLNIGNGHRVEFFDYGPGQLTQVEVTELYRTLIDDFDQGFLFLTKCSKFGLDAFTTEFQLFPNNPTQVNVQVLVDSTGRFADLCAQFGIAANTVVGAAIGDKAVFLWMMYHEVPVTEARSDYSGMRLAEGAQFT